MSLKSKSREGSKSQSKVTICSCEHCDSLYCFKKRYDCHKDKTCNCEDCAQSVTCLFKATKEAVKSVEIPTKEKKDDDRVRFQEKMIKDSKYNSLHKEHQCKNYNIVHDCVTPIDSKSCNHSNTKKYPCKICDSVDDFEKPINSKSSKHSRTKTPIDRTITVDRVPSYETTSSKHMFNNSEASGRHKTKYYENEPYLSNMFEETTSKRTLDNSGKPLASNFSYKYCRMKPTDTKVKTNGPRSNVEITARISKQLLDRDYKPLTQVRNIAVAYSRKDNDMLTAKQLTAQIMNLPFMESRSKELVTSITRAPKTSNDIIAILKEAFKACSCKVCECINTSSLPTVRTIYNALSCDNKESPIMKTKCSIRNQKSVEGRDGQKKTYSHLRDCSKRNALCNCKPCECVSCKAIEEKECRCKPCQCIECKSAGFTKVSKRPTPYKRSNVMVSLPCNCLPCECMDCKKFRQKLVYPYY